MDIIEGEGLLEHAREVGPYLQQQLSTLIDLPIVGNIRGLGLMGCVECVVDHESRQPLILDYEVGNRIDAHCQKLGLLVRPLINMCVMSPPIIIDHEQIDELIRVLRSGIERTIDDLKKEGVAGGL